MTASSEAEFSINGRDYRLPGKPIVVICVDGCGDEYLDASMNSGHMPHLSAIVKKGFRGMARAAVPTFTNVNNAAIATGVPPIQTGISGNFFYDTANDEEVMMNSASYLRCGTIFATAAKAGRKVAIVTAKEKLRDILSFELDGIAFSSEKANQAQLDTHGVEQVEELVGERTPEIYSGAASVYVLKAGAALLERGMADFLYLSLTDYMQHTYSHEETPSLEFYQAMDEQIGRLHEAGAILGITADHGMNSKTLADGTPNVIYLETLLHEQFGENSGSEPKIHSRVICPITDPYVVHHGAFGSFVTVHLSETSRIAEMQKWILGLDGITEVYDREMASRKLELPADRIGDLVVMSARNVVVGRTPDYHDLTNLKARLRSHGGRYEEMVPFIISEPLTENYHQRANGDVRNFDIFEFTCNGPKR